MEMKLEGIQSLAEMAEEGLQGLEDDHPGQERLKEILEWTRLVESTFEALIKKWQSRKEVPA